MDIDRIYVVKYSVSYDIMGEESELSFHKSEEGAYIRLDIEAKEQGFTKDDIISYNKGYSYSRDNRSMYVQPIKLED